MNDVKYISYYMELQVSIPIYIVSLERDEERRKKISSSLSDLGIDFNFFNAVDAKNSDNNEILLKKKTTGDGGSMTNGEIACTLSHQGVYRDIINKNYKWCIILEDDVTVDRRLKLFLEGLESEEDNKLDEDNLYILGGQKGLHDYPVLGLSLFNYISIGTIKLRHVTYNQKKIRRTCCYLISNKMCHELLSLDSSYGTYRADSWKLMKKEGIIKDFYLSEFITHPIATIDNSHLERDRLFASKDKYFKLHKRTKSQLIMKKVRSWLKVSFFSFYW